MDSTQRKGINFDLDTEALQQHIILKETGIMRTMMYGLTLKRMVLNIFRVPGIIPLRLCQKQRQCLLFIK